MRSWRTIFIVAVGVLVAGPIVARYTIGPPLARLQAYEGTVTEKFTKSRGGRFKHNTYHWRVARDNGKTRNVEVDHSVWAGVREGTRVKKERGERNPQIIGPPDGFNLLQERMGDDFPEHLRPLAPAEQ